MPVKFIGQCHAAGCCHCRVFWQAGTPNPYILKKEKIFFYNPFVVSRVSKIFTKAQGKTTSLIHNLFYMIYVSQYLLLLFLSDCKIRIHKTKLMSYLKKNLLLLDT